MRSKKKNEVNITKHFNKLCALASIMAGVLGVIVLDDCTALVVSLFIAVPLLFSKQKHIYW